MGGEGARSFTAVVLLLGLAVATSAAGKGWTPERRTLQTRTCIDAYWDVHPDVMRTPADSREVEDYCVCMTVEWAARVDYDDAVKGREIFAVIADICRKRVGLK